MISNIYVDRYWIGWYICIYRYIGCVTQFWRRNIIESYVFVTQIIPFWFWNAVSFNFINVGQKYFYTIFFCTISTMKMSKIIQGEHLSCFHFCTFSKLSLFSYLMQLLARIRLFWYEKYRTLNFMGSCKV